MIATYRFFRICGYSRFSSAWVAFVQFHQLKRRVRNR